MSDVLMKCGHTANAHKILDDGTSIPSCVICNCDEIQEERPSLEGRYAVCSGCKKTPANTTKSRYDLPFFEYRPNEKFDNYYCGCWGWD